MTDEEVQAIHKYIEAYLGSQDGRGLDIGNPQHFERLVDAARSALGYIAQSAEDAEAELRSVVAMCWLGPHRAGFPPETIRDQLLAILCQSVPDQQIRRERIMEFVIAYGCGKWREVRQGYEGWDTRWQGALRGLVRALEPAVEQSNRWLAAHVAGFPQSRSHPQDEAFPEDTATWSDAWVLGTRLVRPEHELVADEGWSLECVQTEADNMQTSGLELCTANQGYQQTIPVGAKAIWTIQAGQGGVMPPHGQPLPLTSEAMLLVLARDEDAILKTVTAEHSQQTRLKAGEVAQITGAMTVVMWECTCGTTHCQERHRLDRWEPTQVVLKASKAGDQKIDAALTLWDFVASAVKGPQPRIKTGSFVQGVYFPLLAHEGCE